MAKDLGDTIGTAVGRVAREAAQNLTQTARKGGKSPLGGMTGLALGAGLAAAAPLAVKGASKLAKNGLGNPASALQKPVQKAGEKVKGAASDVVEDKIKDAGGPGGIAKEAGKSLIPGLGGGDESDDSGGGKNEAEGAGKGRRMPVQQSVDIGVPIATVYNQFTQFEEWPTFMHRVTSVSQEDETHIAFKSKIWGVSKEFQAEIDEQRPDERVKWHVVEGLSHKGVVTFHELAPRLTRVELNVDVEPGSLIEKFARGARHVKRAMRADLHRFKAYVVMNEEESGEWRGTIDEGEVKSSEGDEGEGKSSQGSSAASSGSRSRRSSSKSDSGRAKAASSSSGRSRSSSGSSKRSSSGSSKRSSSGSSKRSSSGSSSKRSSSNGSSKRSGSSNGGDPSSRSSSGSSRRKSSSRS
jgi:uncharacterized membrane protein